MVANSGFVEAIKTNLANLSDFGTILGLPCILFMLESINVLMIFSQARDVFVCDYIGILKICKVDLYKMYIDPTTSFQLNFFPKFTDVANTYYRIIQNWVTNLNDGREHLVFCIIGQSHMVHNVDSWIGIHFAITWKGFDQAITSVKTQCIIAYDLLVTKLERRFPNHELKNAFGIIYPQYWLWLNDHLSLIKQHYYISQKLDVEGKWVSNAFSKEILDLQTFFFKLIMKSQASKATPKTRDKNPMTKLWHQLATNNLLVHHLFKFMQLVKLAIVKVINKVEDERTFSTLTFMNSKLWNRLARHLDIVICMFTEKFFINKTFPFQVAIMDWNDGDKVKIGVNAWLLGFVVLTCILWILGYYFVLFCCWASLWVCWWCM